MNGTNQLNFQRKIMSQNELFPVSSKARKEIRNITLVTEEM